MRRRVVGFASDDDGNATVEFVVLTAAVVGIAFVSAFALGGGVGGAASALEESMRAEEVAPPAKAPATLARAKPVPRPEHTCEVREDGRKICTMTLPDGVKMLYAAVKRVREATAEDALYFAMFLFGETWEPVNIRHTVSTLPTPDLGKTDAGFNYE